MFMEGTYKDVNNTADAYVLPWIRPSGKIAPRRVIIYTINRETPGHDSRHRIDFEIIIYISSL